MAQQRNLQTVSDNWRKYLMTGEVPSSFFLERLVGGKEFRRLMQRLPADPRCRSCRVPFRGAGGRLMQALGRRPSKLNPKWCDVCEQTIAKNLGGTEIELTMLFADVRGSTSLAERMKPEDYSEIINRFYRVATDILVRADALIEKLMGDGLVAMFVPGFAGPDHAYRAIKTGQKILRATGNGKGRDPWLPVGVGIQSGKAWVGAVGSEEGLNDIVALGDTVNTAARLASMAGTGEMLVTHRALEHSGIDIPLSGSGPLELKGRSDAVDVCVLRSA
jgi:adenylate cyclase